MEAIIRAGPKSAAVKNGRPAAATLAMLIWPENITVD